MSPGLQALRATENRVDHRAIHNAHVSNGAGGGNTGLDDTDDGGIDWGAALFQIDASVAKATTTTTTTTARAPATTTDTTLISRSAPTVIHSRPTSGAPVQPPAMLQRPTAPSRPAPVPSVQSVQPPAMLQRPTAWNSTDAPNPSDTLTTDVAASKIHVDPRQASLPESLQFNPVTVKPVSDENRACLVKHANLSAPLLNGWTLFSHQKRAILRGLLMRRMILALDMGLGKTLIGCVWARAYLKTFESSSLKVIVLCPVSLKKEWKRTAEEATGLKVFDDEAKKGTCNESDTDVKISSWAKVPSPPTATKYIVICDEAHSMQSMQAARTKETLRLVNSKNCIGVLLLTGTPMKNGRPSNLFPLLKAVRHPFGNNQRAYETHFCAGQENNFGRGRVVWNASGSSNLPQLHTLVSSHLLHLTKDECLKDLPKQTRIIQHVPVSSRRQLQHTQALQVLSKVYTAKDATKNGNDAVLGAVQKVRMVSSLAKIDATVELAKSILEKEPAVVIFTSFVQVAQTLHKHLTESGWKGELLTGETPAKKRQDLVDNFQNGLSPVFVCTFGAGGVGLTLTAACTVILLDRPWTPGDAHQAEDRVRRIGQTKPVRCIWMSAFDLDKQIDSMLETKSQTANAVLSETANPNQDQSTAPKLSIFQMLKTILPPGGGLQQTILPFSQSASQSQAVCNPKENDTTRTLRR